VPLERTWSALLDVPRVASALPGATIDPESADGAYRGTMKLEFGAVSAEYAGTAMIQDADDDERVASFGVEAREPRGHGTAAASDEALDVGGALLGPLRERALLVAAGLVVGLMVGRLISRR
jgi:carbon monoxide dehydrogenase subunit G